MAFNGAVEIQNSINLQGFIGIGAAFDSIQNEIRTGLIDHFRQARENFALRKFFGPEPSMRFWTALPVEFPFPGVKDRLIPLSMEFFNNASGQAIAGSDKKLTCPHLFFLHAKEDELYPWKRLQAYGDHFDPPGQERGPVVDLLSDDHGLSSQESLERISIVLGYIMNVSRPESVSLRSGKSVSYFP
ncbi:MAG: hypothetical protein KDJ15_07995, partial [Alphaproteobacteria bacterium]|nr:hypothetical protein [Alphaproteobacteria bacterium]